jgi:catechol 2,3-dioxygenase-like lactoylglutathione lyase family enzyme
MQLKYAILYVDDVTRSIEFYEQVFGLERIMIHESGDYGELDTGATTLSFSSRRLMTDLGKSPGTPDPASPVFEIAFETQDVAAALEKARAAGASVVQEVREEAWGQTTAYIVDNSGYLVEICSPVHGAS